MFCQKCGAAMPDGSKVCPKCGAQQGVQPAATTTIEKPKKKKIGMWIALGIVAIIIIAAIVGGGKGDSGTPSAAGTSAQTGETSEAPKNDWDGKFDVENLAMTTDDLGYAHITGSLANLTDKEYKYVQVELNVYDESGAQIGTALANTNNLEAKGTWKFEALGTQTGVKTYKLKDISAY